MLETFCGSEISTKGALNCLVKTTEMNSEVSLHTSRKRLWAPISPSLFKGWSKMSFTSYHGEHQMALTHQKLAFRSSGPSAPSRYCLELMGEGTLEQKFYLLAHWAAPDFSNLAAVLSSEPVDIHGFPGWKLAYSSFDAVLLY